MRVLAVAVGIAATWAMLGPAAAATRPCDDIVRETAAALDAYPKDPTGESGDRATLEKAMRDSATMCRAGAEFSALNYANLVRRQVGLREVEVPEAVAETPSGSGDKPAPGWFYDE
ncbi:MAG: hypothetical protein H7840_04980 [Alphaproteobacteria bacterium]